MSSAYQINIVFLVKFFNNVRAERMTHSSLVIIPGNYILVRITPKQITQQSVVWYVRRSIKIFDLLQTVQFWTKSTVHAQNSVFNDRANWHEIKAFTKFSPQCHSIASFAFIIKSIRSINSLTLMVSS